MHATSETEDPLSDYHPLGDMDVNGSPFDVPCFDDYTEQPDIPEQDDYQYQDSKPAFTGLPEDPHASEAAQYEDLPGHILDTVRNCLASMQDRSGSELIELLRFMLSSVNVLDHLDARPRKNYDRLSEILIGEYADDPSRVVDLNDVPGIIAASGKVRAELEVIRTRLARADLPHTPSAHWKALVNYVQRIRSRETLAELVGFIDAGDTDETCMGHFRTLEPPSANRTLQNASYSQTAKQWEEDDIAAVAEAPGFRISSGYPTLDYAYTQKDSMGNDAEPRGSWGPGELHIIAAPTGNGKSATARKLITAAAEDLVTGWGRTHDKVLIAITEETPKIVYTVADMGKGQPFHHLADNLVIANIGASRKRFIHSVWDCVIDAYHKSRDTGLPISSCGLPSLVVLDYVGGIVEDGESADTTAIEKTANLMLRGIGAWDVQMQEEFSGESFAAYAGMSWPTGMEAFRPAVIGFAQFRKLADPQWYDPNAKSVNMDDFVVPNADGDAGWKVQPGDFRIPTQGEIRGSGVLINHATSLIILHRSRPQKNPKLVDPDTGRARLADDRARWLLVKTRNGSDLPFVEMRFDSIPSGLRGQFFDLRAEIAVGKSMLTPTDCYGQVGDPILPHRPMRTPFDGVSYR